MKSKIQWTEETWNPVPGCAKVSPGCKNCYAIREAARLAGNTNQTIAQRYFNIVRNGNWTGNTNFAADALLKPLRKQQPTTYFISLSDLFFDKRPDEDIDRVFAVMALCPQHTFQILTKYADRMQRYFASKKGHFSCEYQHIPAKSVSRLLPFDNVHLGVSVENQKYADERIPMLRDTPAALRFISYEPALEAIDFSAYLNWLDWIIVGGESGHSARPFNVEWARSTIRQGRDALVPVFVKQLGAAPYSMTKDDVFRFWRIADGPQAFETGPFYAKLDDKKGGDMDEWPVDVRVREMPYAPRPENE